MVKAIPKPGTSRAVRRTITPKNIVECARCGLPVVFMAPATRRARARQRLDVGKFQIVCNVYEGSRWDRVEHYHEKCYELDERPHGPVIRGHEHTSRS